MNQMQHNQAHMSGLGGHSQGSHSYKDEGIRLFSEHVDYENFLKPKTDRVFNF